jgi:restriction modification system DNA specificity domain protein
MARAKKEATLTPEERLQVALVPDWDWPYKLPENWCWTKIGSISSLHRGVSYKKTDAHTERRENSCLVMRGGNICEGSIDTEADNIYVDISLVAENQIVRKNDIIIVASTGSTKVIGRAGISKMDYLDVAFGAFLLLVRPSTKVNQRYIDYFFLSDNYRNRIKKLASGININNIRGEYITETLVPLAPLAEQQRIVDRIESLFTKLDEAKEKAQTVVDSFETRKAAILHKAFTGELTAKWREERGVGMESWHLRTIGEVCENVKVGIVIKPSQYYVPQNEGTPAFRSANVRECRIDDFDWVYLNEKGMKDNSRSIVHTGDVLVVRSGNPGTACVVPERFDGYNAIDILIAVPNKKIIISDYLCYYTNSPLGKKTVEIGKRGIALTHFNVKGFSQMPINIPTIPEQVVIVRTLGDLFAQEQQAKEAAEAVLDQIDLMKKSILARAFRGELGTNDPNEESAVELLRQVIEQEDGDVIRPKAKAKRIAIPAEIKPLLSGANEEAIVKLLLKAAPQSVSTQTVMSISKKKFELMDALRNLEKKQIVSKSDPGEYSLVR